MSNAYDFSEKVLNEAIESFDDSIQRFTLGFEDRSKITIAPPSVGRSALLKKYGSIAKTRGWIVQELKVTEHTHFPESIFSMVFDTLTGIRSKQKSPTFSQQAFRVLRSFGIAHKIPPPPEMVDYEPLRGVGGRISKSHLSSLVCEVGEVVKDEDLVCGVLFIIDGIDLLDENFFSSFFIALRDINRRNLPVMFAGAGSPLIYEKFAKKFSLGYEDGLFRIDNIEVFPASLEKQS